MSATFLRSKTEFLSVCDDTVHALFFPMQLLESPSETAAWEELCENINKTIKVLSDEYIWHKEGLKVYLPITNPENVILAHLKSTTCFGDNIEDEWFIVYLIFQISMTFENVIIQLTDSDGDFLLIEAAHFLPPWANPESTENRVFIYNGHIHMIPPTIVDLTTNLTNNEAVKLVFQFPEQTKVSPDIEKAIWSRVGQYPQKMYEDFHNAVVKLPLDLAALLMLDPSFISTIVDSYCNHDMFDVKCSQNVEYTDLVCIKVKFTKCLYAMLLNSKLIRINVQVPEDDKKSVLGLKLTCGFHILMKRQTNDVFSSKEFRRFTQNLTENGYFKEYIEGSKVYKELLEKAKQYFLETECPINTFTSKNIVEVMNSIDYQNTKASLKNSDFTREDLGDDSDNWMSIDPNELNELLNTHFDDKIKFKKGDVMSAQVITNKLTDFFKETSDYEGVDSRETKELYSESIEFDSDEFVNCLEKMLNILSTNSESENICDGSEIEFDETDLDDEVIDEPPTKFMRDNVKDDKAVMFNLTQSIKEEGLSGPSSNLLQTIGINKNDILLDSDDD